MARVHIIGAGLSGLSAAVRLLERDIPVTLYESAGQAGGRCRSFFDKYLERDIDNGNHLIMSGNKSALSYLSLLNARDELVGPSFAIYPFVDVASKQRWTVRLNEGFIPFWIFDEKWRVPDTQLGDYFKAAAIAFAGPDKTVSDVIDTTSVLFTRFWEPLTLAVLNTTPQIGSAQLLWSVIRETFLLGGQASVPLVAREGLGPTFIDPAIKFIEENNGIVRLGTRLRHVLTEGGAVTGLDFGTETIALDVDDHVILALPPTRLTQLMSEFDPPTDDASILNVHFRYGGVIDGIILGDSPFIALTSSLAQWVFVRDDVISVTTSASNALGADDQPNDVVVSQIWQEICTALDLGAAQYERVRVIREKRATPDQSPAGVRKRLSVETPYRNLFLAGDHTNTGVPATIEGSIRSGETASKKIVRQLG